MNIFFKIVMSTKSLAFYITSSKTFAKIDVSLRELAKVDAQLTGLWVDTNDLCSHKIDVQDNVAESESLNNI